MALVIGTIERMGGPTKRTILKAGRLQTAVWHYLKQKEKAKIWLESANGVEVIGLV